MKIKDITLFTVASILLFTSCRKDFPRQMAISIISETYTSNSATFVLNVADMGGNKTVEYGVCYSASNTSPTIEDSKQLKTTDAAGTYTVEITGLIPGINYNFMAIIKADEDIHYINTGNTVTDVDNNVYHTLSIGSQVWMVENLKVTHYRNGDAIPNVMDSTTWYNLTSGALCNYNNIESNSNTYGHLYNWYSIADTRGICPDGWHVPSMAEWNTLVNFLGGDSIAGGKLKESGTAHWNSPNTGATNISGFNGLPGGYRNTDFEDINNKGKWWSCDTAHIPGLPNSVVAWNMILNYDNVYTTGHPILSLDDFSAINAGRSIRCIKDN